MFILFSLILLESISSPLSDVDWCHIIQLSAVCGKRKFNKFILPHRTISPGASSITGFTKRHGWLYRYGEPVDTISLFDALTSFIDFLYSFRRPVILAAHYSRRFDAVVLTRVLKRFSLWQDFQQMVSGFLDTIEVSRDLFPYLRRHSQQYLVWYFLGVTYNAHDGLEDAVMLKKLFNTWNLDRWYISDFIFSMS